MQVSPISRFLVLSITLGGLFSSNLSAADKPEFRVQPADSYSHQTADRVTVGAAAYDKADQVEQIFGKKLDLRRYGVLPVLVVVENKGQTAVDLRDLEVSLVAADGRHANAVPPDQLFGLAHSKPKTTINSPLPFPTRSKKNPFNSPELVTRSFTAKVVPPGDSVSGFFYFEANLEREDQIYINGLKDVRSGRELIYFEFPLNSIQ